MNFYLHPLAIIGENVRIGSGSKVWANVQLREGVVIGRNCIVGKDSYIGPNVEIGDNCKIQNGAHLYEPANLGSGVFVGPGAILTNDHNPRAINPDGSLKSPKDWQPVGVVIKQGASIGAGALCIAPVTIGSWAFVAAGSVVTRDVPNFAMVVGSPARQTGWVGKAGYRLTKRAEIFECPISGSTYRIVDGSLEEDR